MRHRFLLSALCLFLAVNSGSGWAAVPAPVLKWQHGGCYNSWCETGWYSSPAVADVTGDGVLDVIGSAYSIVALDGYFLPGWPKRPTTSELRGLLVADLDQEGTAEIVVNGALSSRTNTWVYEHDGTLRPNWPRLNNDSGYAAGVYNDNSAAGDLDGDGLLDLVVPSDVHYICAYTPAGGQLPVHEMCGDKGWGKVGVWEDLSVELRGWGECSGVRSERYRTNFAGGAAVVADVDGLREILFSSYDGRLHAVWLDKTEHHNWPFSVYRPAEGVWRFASEPVVADLDNDGFAEVLFGSWTRKGSYLNGMLHILDYRGDVLHEIALPAARTSSVTWNGALAAPRLANIDADDDLEIVLNTAYSGFVAYDLPGSSAARVLWGSGRAGRIWRQQDMSDTDKLAGVIRTLQILAGRVPVVSPDPDGNGRSELADTAATVTADQLGRQAPPVGQGNGDLVGAVNDVMVGQDMAVGADDKTGPVAKGWDIGLVRQMFVVRFVAEESFDVGIVEKSGRGPVPC